MWYEILLESRCPGYYCGEQRPLEDGRLQDVIGRHRPLLRKLDFDADERWPDLEFFSLPFSLFCFIITVETEREFFPIVIQNLNQMYIMRVIGIVCEVKLFIYARLIIDWTLGVGFMKLVL